MKPLLMNISPSFLVDYYTTAKTNEDGDYIFLGQDDRFMEGMRRVEGVNALKGVGGFGRDTYKKTALSSKRKKFLRPAAQALFKVVNYKPRHLKTTASKASKCVPLSLPPSLARSPSALLFLRSELLIALVRPVPRPTPPTRPVTTSSAQFPLPFKAMDPLAHPLGP
jgi:hypothetical protein